MSEVQSRRPWVPFAAAVMVVFAVIVLALAIERGDAVEGGVGTLGLVVGVMAFARGRTLR